VDCFACPTRCSDRSRLMVIGKGREARNGRDKAFLYNEFLLIGYCYVFDIHVLIASSE
jgi:hypothetical protein